MSTQIEKLAKAATLLEEARRPVSFSGAGLSAESGLSTFRDPDSEALWSRHDWKKLATPEAFAANPERVTDWYAHRRKLLAGAMPNPAHFSLASRPQMLHITQNVDDLLERAGAKRVVHLHGTLTRNRCSAACGHGEEIEMGKPPPLAACPICGNLMRPGVVWFGETLPEDELDRAIEACTTCDVLLVVGTSAVVNPAAGLIELAKESAAKVVLVDIRPTRASGLADIDLIGKAGEVLPRLLAPPG